MVQSVANDVELTCPQCGQSFQAEVWLIVDTAESPDLAERIRDGTLHDVPCPQCGHAGQADAPLLLYRPDVTTPLIFSPAQHTTAEQDQAHAAGLVGTLREQLGAEWRDEWLADGLPGVPRRLLPTALSDDSEVAIEQIVAQAAEEMERLREEDPEAYRQLEEAARQMEEANSIETPAEFEGDPAARALAEKLVAWIQQETLDEAEAYLNDHEADLLTDRTEAAMELLVQANPRKPNLPDHQGRLARAREMGIAAMYADIRHRRQREGLQEALQRGLAQSGPIGAAVWQFIQADDEAAATLLQTQGSLLLTLDAGDLLRQVMEAADAGGDESLGAILHTRRQQWQEAYRARVGGPLRRVPAEPTRQQDAQPERWIEHAEHQPVQAERGSTYTVIRANQCAIGDNALVINNVGRLPLRWQRPAEGRPRLARAAVGREAELDELHRRLIAEQSAAVVSRGTSAALRGHPAIGKTTLAAMYADRYGERYPGGVMWLDIGPDRRSADSVTPVLQRIAAYAYAADVQAQSMLENNVFGPDVVRALLHGHGALLVIIDDVWDPAALRELQDALPADAFVLLTTRDYDVAYALENSPTAIQPLDVLTAVDARSLLQKGALGLSCGLADQVAKGLGRHALALTLAAGALNRRGAEGYAQTAAELLRRVSAGHGFGDLPRMDKAERLTEVEIAIKYSYDELGRGEHGAAQQAWFRALGAFAQEADWETTAVAALWEVEVAAAREFLIWLDGLSLIQGADATDRWQQHALLRAYALSLQTAGERIQFPERHSDYYIALTKSCYESKPRAYDRVEQEFAQLQHAFVWCQENSPRRATRLALLLDDFMRNRGRVVLLNQWLQIARQGSEIHGDRLGKANTLQSLGDLERRLGNIEQARAHYDAALPLFEAEQEPGGKMNTWVSLARLEAALGNWPAAEQYYQQTFALAEQVHFADHPIVEGWKQEYTQLGQGPQPSPEEMLSMQRLADQLIAWIQTPDWAQSEAYLQDHAVELLSNEADAALELLRQGNPASAAIPQHQALLRRCREIGIGPAYQEFDDAQEAARQIAQDPAARAVAALSRVDSMDALECALDQHPALLELSTLEQLADVVTSAHEADQQDAARHLLALLTVLLERYNQVHREGVDPAEQNRLVDLYEALLPTADGLDADLATALRRSLGWALNTLGNTRADQGDHVAAVEGYNRAIGYAPEEAMLYRNRAREYLELGQATQAEADIERAAALEPDAPRIVELRQALMQQRDES